MVKTIQAMALCLNNCFNPHSKGGSAHRHTLTGHKQTQAVTVVVGEMVA